MSKIITALVFFLLLLVPSRSYAWGTSAHRFIMDRAIDLLPPELKPFFDHFRSELVVRVVDPDGWRSVGWEDDPNHFVNFGVPEYGPPPFKTLPREYGAAIEKFGMATLKKNGLLPWRESEEFGNLRRAFEGFARNTGFSPASTVLFAAVAAHYIEDAHQPLHATNNYDGLLTGQSGVHSRFESGLFERYRDRLTITPAQPTPILHPTDAAFDALITGYDFVRPILDADKQAITGKDTYDDEYFDRFFAKVKPILEKRLSESITATAAVIAGAWEAAGKPVVKTSVPPSVQKVRAPK